MKENRVVVAMSGGVDSSLAATLLRLQGYETIGVTMQIWPAMPPGEEVRAGGCCSLGAVEDARRVADHLGIPYYVVNLRQEFQEGVIDYFCAEYQRGRTPNPCIACNLHVKFRALLAKAFELEARYLATGHYARLEFDSRSGRYLLRRGVDPRKDQSYVLFGLRQDQMPHLLFPLGGFTKEETRRLARRHGLPVAGKQESQEICFVPDDNYRRFLERRIPGSIRPGPIIDREGKVLGRHAGLPFYTIGQRRGLGLTSPYPLYVVDLDVEKNAVVVGPAEELERDALLAEGVNYIPFEAPEGPLRVTARIRYRAPEVPATVIPLPEGWARVTFDRPLRAITPGQAVVFYQGDLVVGGGFINRPE